MADFGPQPFTVRYWAPELHKMKVCGLIGIGFMCGPFVLYQSHGVASHFTATMALWIWGIFGLPGGLLLLAFSWWAFRRSMDDRIALDASEETFRIVPMFLPPVELRYDQLVGTTVQTHLSPNGPQTSIYFIPRKPEELIAKIPLHLRWWVRAASFMSSTPLTLPNGLVDTKLEDIATAMYANEAAGWASNSQVSESGSQSTNLALLDHAVYGPLGIWDSSGYMVAPTNRIVSFQEDGTAFLHVEFNGPDYDFRWKTSGPNKIALWFDENPETLLTMSYYIDDQRIRFYCANSINEVESNLQELSLDLATESMTYSGPPK